VHRWKTNVEVKSYFSNLSRSNVVAEIPVDYILSNPKGEKLLILLHGYQQAAQIIYEKLKLALPKDFVVLVPNGLYPIRQLKEGHYDVKFAWYLYDDLKDEYLIDPVPAATALKSLIENLGFKEKPKHIVGYSQGGYFAPFLAERLENVERVIGISSVFLKDEISKPYYRLDGLHGKDDSVVNSEVARLAHEELIKNGASGKFEVLEGEGHKITPPLVSALARMWD